MTTPSPKPNLDRAKLASFQFPLLRSLLDDLGELPCDVPDDFHEAVEAVNDRYVELLRENEELRGD